jgi:hypothetical protein
MDQTAGSQEPLRTLGGYLDDGPDRPARILQPDWPRLVLAMGNSNGDIAMLEQIRGPDPIAAGITPHMRSTYGATHWLANQPRSRATPRRRGRSGSRAGR